MSARPPVAALPGTLANQIIAMSIVPTLSVLVTWAALAIALGAIGILFLNRLAGGIEPSWQYVFCGIWTGFALLIAVLVLWHFFLPVNGMALAVFAGAASLALLREWRWFAAVLRVPFGRLFGLVAGLFAIWTANHSLGPGAYDDYAYEFPAIRWYYEHPVVPGLANLHGRIGFNNSHHLFAAMLSVGLWRGAVNHVFNGFFVALVCVFILSEVRNVAKVTGGPNCSLFAALLLCPCVSLVLFPSIAPMLSTLKADVFVCVATVSLAILFLRWAAAAAETTASSVLAATTLLIGCLIPGVKLSGSVFCLLILAVVIVRSFRPILAKTRNSRVIAVALMTGVVSLVSVPVRGVILSGYPFFPSTAFAFNVDWRVPVGMVDLEHVIITSFARLPTAVDAQSERARWSRQVEAERASIADLKTPFDPHQLLGQPWIRRWAASVLISDRMTILLPFVLTVASIPLLLVRRKRERVSQSGTPPAWAYATVSSASIAALVFWFVQAPAPRFAMGDMWVLFASIIAWIVQRKDGQRNWTAWVAGLLPIFAAAAMVGVGQPHLAEEVSRRVLALLVFAGCWFTVLALIRTAKPLVLAALCLTPALFQHGERLVEEGYTTARSMLWINYFPHRAPPTVLRRTCSGLGIYQVDYPAFETPLPNAQYFNPLLQLRTARLEDGFVLRDCGAPK